MIIHLYIGESDTSSLLDIFDHNDQFMPLVLVHAMRALLEAEEGPDKVDRKKQKVDAKTWSPFLNRFTSLPADSISPANSIPSMVLFGFLIPRRIRARSRCQRGPGILRLRMIVSPMVTVVAWILTNTSLSLGVGFSISLS